MYFRLLPDFTEGLFPAIRNAHIASDATHAWRVFFATTELLFRASDTDTPW